MKETKNKKRKNSFIIIILLLIVFIVVAIYIVKKDDISYMFDTNDESINAANQNALEVSIIQLIANPKDYDGKIVRVIGVGSLEFEGNGVYLSRDDWKYVSRNGLWIEVGNKATPYNVAKNWNGKYVIIEGTFDAKMTGHFGMWSGAIVNITRYELWEDFVDEIRR